MSINFIRLPFYDYMGTVFNSVKLHNGVNPRNITNEIRFHVSDNHIQEIKRAWYGFL